MIIDELISILGYEVKGEDKARRFAAGMDSIAAKAKTMATVMVAAGTLAAGAVAAVGAGMFKMAKDAAGPLDDLVKFSDRVNVNIESLQEWQFAAEQSGASAGEFQGSIETLSKNLGEVARGTGRAKKAFDDYGLSAKDANGKIKSADVVMGELADKFQKLTDQQALDLGGKLGMTPGMITMLKSGRVEIEKLQDQARKNGLIFSEEDARNAERFNDALNLFDRSVKAIRHRIGVEFLPVLSDVMDGIQGWMQGNQELIRQNIKVWSGRVVSFMRDFIGVLIPAVTAVGRFAGALVSAVGAVGRFVSEMLGLKTEWAGVMLVLGAITAVVAPWLAAFGALVLIVEDFVVYLQGGESLIGAAIDRIKAKFNEWAPSISAAWDSVLAVLEKAPQFKVFEGAVNRLKEYGLDQLFNSWKEAGVAVWEGIRTLGSGLADVAKAVAGLMSGDGKPTAISMLADSLGRFFSSALIANIQVLSGQVKIIASGFRTLGEVLSKIAKGDWSGAFDAFVEGFKRQAEIVTQIIEKVIQAFVPDFNLEEAWGGVVKFFEDMASRISGIADRIVGTANRIREALGLDASPMGKISERRDGESAAASVGGMLNSGKGEAGQKGATGAPPRAANSNSPYALPGDPEPKTYIGIDPDKLQKMLENFKGNSEIASPEQSLKAVNQNMEDNRQDNRDQSVNPSITINQTVQQATQAPAAAAQATATAVSGAASARPARVEGSPQF